MDKPLAALFSMRKQVVLKMYRKSRGALVGWFFAIAVEPAQHIPC